MKFNSRHNPLTKMSDDKLSFRVYAERVAKSILNYESKESLVISIEGEWGSGKTTFINFFKELIKNRTSNNNFMYEFIHFNPWLITNTEQVVKLFFEELQKVILSNSVDAKVKEFKKDFKRFTSYFVPDDISIGINSTKVKYNIAKLFKSETKTLEELKRDINSYLSQLSVKIIIVIDDIDRLTDAETEHIFRLVKGVADFDNLVYILSYDKAIVSQSLEKFKSENGQRYLEKIIHYPLTIPKAHKVTIKKMLLDEFKRILEGLQYANNTISSTDWDKLFDVLLKYIKTVRDKNQLVNIVSFEYPIIYEDTNILDFIVLSVIKLKVYPLYEYIKSNPENLFDFKEEENSKLYKFDPNYKKKVQQIKNNNLERFHIYTDLLEYLFSDSSKFYRDNTNNRIANINYFENYFSFSVSSDKLANKEYIEIKDKLFSDDFEAYKKSFSKYKEKYSYFLDRLQAQSYRNKNAFINTAKSFSFNENYLEQMKVLMTINQGLSYKEEINQYFEAIYSNNVDLPLNIQIEVFQRFKDIISKRAHINIKKIVRLKLETIDFKDFVETRYDVPIIEQFYLFDASLIKLSYQWDETNISVTKYQKDLLNYWKSPKTECYELKYLEEKKIILCKWLQKCSTEEYRNLLRYGLELLKIQNVDTWTMETINGFGIEDNGPWFTDEFISQAEESGCKRLVFIVDDNSSLKEEVNKQTKSLGEYFQVLQIRSLDNLTQIEE